MLAIKKVIGYSKPAVIILRLLCGFVFIVSGLSKGIDPWGFIYKIQEYLAGWSIEMPWSLMLVFAIGLSAYEFIFGLMLAMGAYRRWAPRWLLLTMVVMLPLSMYIFLADPVSDCGCFGDFIKLSNFATFVKNIIITLALIYLCRNNLKVNFAAIRPHFQWLGSLTCLFYIIVVSLIGYLVQPLVDFRPYKTDTSFIFDDNVDCDTSEMTFVYARDGVTQEFDINSLPDSTWTFVERKSVEMPYDDYLPAIYDGDDDMTEYVLDGDGLMLLLTFPHIEIIDVAYAYSANELADAVEREGGRAIGLVAGSAEAIRLWQDLSMATYPCYSVDDTSLKTLVRGSVGAVLLNDGKIVWKRSLSSIDFDTVDGVATDKINILDIGPDRSIMAKLTIAFIVIMIMISLLSHLFKAKGSNIEKKNVNLQNTSDDASGDNILVE